MNPRYLCLLLALATPGCAVLEQIGRSSESRAEARRLAEIRTTAAAEHALFRSQTNWKKRTHANSAILESATPERTSIEISLDEQRGILLVDGAIAMDFPVATGKRSHPTPEGSYSIIDKRREYASNLYGKIVDAEGNVVVADADTRTDAVPEGGSFEGSRMPYWMRLTNSGVGLHAGYVPGRPASHGCIRLRRETAGRLFALTRMGTPVVVARVAPSLAPVEKRGRGG
jgi:lipoprotein-anchoring transpeptidase ErfK/SrfK